MDERGWGWQVSETRRAQLVEWIVQRSAEEPDGVYVPLDRFYDGLPDQSMNTYAIALDDVNSLVSRSLLDLANSFGGVESLAAQSTPAGRAFVDDLQAARSNTARRRSACRDAMVDWLYSRDAVSPPGVDRNRILHDQRGYFFAEPFTANDLDAAAAWLYRNNLVRGTMIAEAQGPVVLYLTDSGVKCAEDLSSDTSAYLERQQYRASGPTVNIGTSGPVQVAGDNARQVQNTEQFISGAPGTGPRPDPGRATTFAGNRKAVMVVYGHDREANDALFAWLRAIGLQPREWGQLIRASGSASPFIGEVLDKALRDVQAVVAFFTPDEYVTTAGAGHGRGRLQARPNVLIEAGMPLITHPTRTNIAVLGDQELPSDLAGRHYVRLSHTDVQPLNDLAGRLGDAGCDIDLSGSDWLNPGRFPNRETVPPAGEHPASQTRHARTAAGPPGKDRTYDDDAEDLSSTQAASAESAGEPHDASTETRRHEAGQRAKQDTDARQVLVTIEARPGERFTHLITVSTPITYPVKQVEAQIAWQVSSGLGMTSTGFGGDPPRADGHRRYYTFRASVNPEIRPEPVIRFVDLHGNRYYQFRDHTQRFPANTDWTQALTAIDKWLRTGPSAQ